MKNMLLYISLFLLVILLLLPPGLRLFGKNLYKEKKLSKQEDVLEILNCTKINETIDTSFLNGKAYNIKYEISGNFSLENEDENEKNDNQKNDLEENNENKVLIRDDFKEFAEIKYIESKNLTEYRLALNIYENIPEKLSNYARSINEMSMYYEGLSFSCTTQKY